MGSGASKKKGQKTNADIKDSIIAGHAEAMIVRGHEFLKQAKMQEIKFYISLDDKNDEFYQEN